MPLVPSASCCGSQQLSRDLTSRLMWETVRQTELIMLITTPLWNSGAKSHATLQVRVTRRKPNRTNNSDGHRVECIPVTAAQQRVTRWSMSERIQIRNYDLDHFKCYSILRCSDSFPLPTQTTVRTTGLYYRSSSSSQISGWIARWMLTNMYQKLEWTLGKGTLAHSCHL